MRIIQATIPILYRSVDMDGIIVDCNKAYADRMGYSVEEVIGTSLFDHAPEDVRETLKREFSYWKRTCITNVIVGITLVTKSGERIDAVRTYRNRYKGDHIVGVDSSIMEKHEIKKMQELYSVRTRDGYEDANVMRRSVDYIGTIIDCNQSYLDNMGYTKDEVVGISLYEHTAPRSRGNLHANMSNWRVGLNYDAKIWMKRKNGGEFPTQLTASDETDGNGVIVGRTVSLRILDE